MDLLEHFMVLYLYELFLTHEYMLVILTFNKSIFLIRFQEMVFKSFYNNELYDKVFLERNP